MRAGVSWRGVRWSRDVGHSRSAGEIHIQWRTLSCGSRGPFSPSTHAHVGPTPPLTGLSPQHHRTEIPDPSSLPLEPHTSMANREFRRRAGSSTEFTVGHTPSPVRGTSSRGARRKRCAPTCVETRQGASGTWGDLWANVLSYHLYPRGGISTLL